LAHYWSTLTRTFQVASSSQCHDGNKGAFCRHDAKCTYGDVTHVIPGDAGVSAVTSLGNDVFVARDDDSQNVAVYDAVTFTLQRRLSVPGRGDSFGSAACASNRCLYASDYDNDCVHRVELSGRNAVTK